MSEEIKEEKEVLFKGNLEEFIHHMHEEGKTEELKYFLKSFKKDLKEGYFN